MPEHDGTTRRDGDSGGREITIEGSILLGDELQLEWSPAAHDETGTQYTPDHPPHHWWLCLITPSMSPSLVNGPSMCHRVSRQTDKQLRIVDEGLNLAFAIVGAPGVGKTPFFLSLISQMLKLKQDPFEKYGALILDPKGLMIDDVRTIFANTGRPEQDLVVINANELAAAPVNIIDVGLEPLGAVPAAGHSRFRAYPDIGPLLADAAAEPDGRNHHFAASHQRRRRANVETTSRDANRCRRPASHRLFCPRAKPTPAAGVRDALVLRFAQEVQAGLDEVEDPRSSSRLGRCDPQGLRVLQPGIQSTEHGH